MRARWHWAIPPATILLLLAPLLATDRTFAIDWGNHYWLIYMQGVELGQLHHPSIYLQSSLGAFYPYYAFYGGTFYAISGFFSKLFGTDVAVIVAYAGASAAAYLGWTWMAKMAGVRGWRTQLPALIALTTPFAVSNLYGRGGIPEVVATSMLPLVAAAGISLVREPRLRLRDAAAFVVGLVFLTGSHVLSMVWGLVFLGLVTVILVACHWPYVKERGMRLLTIAWLGVLAGCLNAWMLGPTILFHSRTLENEPDMLSQTQFTDPENLFRILRNTPDFDPVLEGDINAALPVLAMLWALVVGVLVWRRVAPRNRALALGLIGVLIAFVVLILHPSLIWDLPEALQYIQFPYRLLVYANFCVVGVITLILAALERRPSSRSFAAVVALAVIAVFNLVISVQQNFEVRSWLAGRGEAVASTFEPPPSWYAFLQFGDGEGPIVAPTLPRPLTVPVAEEGIRDSYRIEYPAGPAGTAQTNIATGSYLVDVSGAEPVGHSEAGQMVVRLPASPNRPRTVVVSAEDGPAVVLSRWISIASLAFCAVAVGLVLIRRRRRT